MNFYSQRYSVIRIWFLTVALMGFATFSLPAQELSWTRQITGDYFNYGQSVAMDQQGNSYGLILGWDTLNVSGVTVTLGGNDCLLVKYNSQGQVVWKRVLDGDSGLTPANVTVDAADNIYVVGTFGARVLFGQDEPGVNDTVEVTGSGSVFVVKYDSAGRVVWARSYYGLSQVECHRIAVDRSGQIALTGAFRTFGVGGTEFEVPAEGYGRVWLARLDPSGNLLWLRTTSSTHWAAADTHAVAFDRDRNVYLTGGFLFNVTIGGTQLESQGQYDMFIAKYDANGNLVWLRSATGPGTVQPTDIVVDANGFVYVSGHLGASSFGGPNTGTFGTVQVSGSIFHFLVKYDSDGNAVWGRNDGAERLAMDATGHVYGTGAFTSPRQFGGTLRFPSGNGDLYAVKWDTGGNLLWSQVVAGAEQDNGGGIAVDPDGNVAIAGTWYITDGSKPHGAYMAPVFARLSGGAPLILSQPQDQIVAAGQNAIFTVSLANVPVTSFQWLKNGVALANGSKVSGSTTSALQVSQAALEDEGNYSLQVVTPDRLVLSAPARLRLSGLMRFVSTERLEDGRFQASFTGVNGRVYDVEWSTNLVNWQFLTNGYAVGGMMTVSDPNAATGGQRFYRAVSR